MNTGRMVLVAASLSVLLAIACDDSSGAADVAGQAGQTSAGQAGQTSAGQAGQAGQADAGQAGSAGEGAGQGGAGGAACTPWDEGAAGASHIEPTVPVAGSACLVEGFELCTGPLFNTPATLSKCLGGVWTTQETNSACNGGYQECNLGSNPIVNGNCCQGAARLCGNKFCDGTRWWLPGS